MYPLVFISNSVSFCGQTGYLSRFQFLGHLLTCLWPGLGSFLENVPRGQDETRVYAVER